MSPSTPRFLALWAVVGPAIAAANEPPDVASSLGRSLLAPGQAMAEIQDHIEPRIPPMPRPQSVEEWEAIAQRMRQDTLSRVVFRGEAAAWREARCRVEWLETLEGGPEYRIKKLRYEAIPGLWIPALLYEPKSLAEKTPVVLNVNGHDGNGKAADYKQIRCINQAKRGMLALNVEWIGMGQLRGDGFRHGLINAIDLCGTSGIAVHYLAMSRALDLLLDLPRADPERVAVTGLSGGGWQTIFISALDQRVTLSDPVAGYSSFKTRVRYLSDLGDSEQTPCDLGTITDYAHLTAMRAPRPTLLTFNLKDNCCFAAPHALPPLLQAAWPIYALYGQHGTLRSHVNEVPGTHNYLRENREAFYRMVGDFFYPSLASYDPTEIPSDAEVKSKEELEVELPPDNLDLSQIAARLAGSLPRGDQPPHNPEDRPAWSSRRRAELREVLRYRDLDLRAERRDRSEAEGFVSTYWTFRLGETWTVPGVELTRGEPTEGTAILIADEGRKSLASLAEETMHKGYRVLAVDPFYLGESHPQERDYLWCLLLSTIGDRPLGTQAAQLRAIAGWAQARWHAPVTLIAVGPRTGTIALATAALDDQTFSRVQLRGPRDSLKQWIELGTIYNAAPEQFCFGLLESFDLSGLKSLIQPRAIDVLPASPVLSLRAVDPEVGFGCAENPSTPSAP